MALVGTQELLVSLEESYWRYEYYNYSQTN